MKNLSVMIKPASSLCNLRCRYCFYAEVAGMREVENCGIMSEQTQGRILSNIRKDLEAGDSVHFVFQGGEPSLAGIAFFESFTEKVSAWQSEIRVSYALQTNGVLLDEAWCKFLKRHSFLVGISLDILPKSHDETRVDANGNGTYKTVLSAIRLMEKHQVEYNVLCTLTNGIARHPKQVWKWLCDADIAYTQFTPCLGSLDKTQPSVYALTPNRFASFYKELFREWLADFQKGRYRSIKFFDDCVNLLMYGRPTSCGMDGVCRPQLVVEADGSVYPCDFYCLDTYRLGNLTEQGPMELLASEKTAQFLKQENHVPAVCTTCRYQRFCGGNCKRMRENICLSEQENTCGYREFLDSCISELSMIAKRYR